ncbi:neutral cholesterol ester hydrolase 1-like isoform X2 [Watersipora subatra]
MALKLISTLTLLVLASFLYKVWDKTKVPEDIPLEDVSKVKTIEFACRGLYTLEKLMSHLNLDTHAIGRPIMSFMIDFVQGQTWPFAQHINKTVMVQSRHLGGVPVLHFKYNEEKEKKSKLQGVIIYFHGGGGEWLTAAYPQPTLRRLTESLRIPSVSVEYRLAPEHPYPAALADCLKVTNYILKNHKELAVDPNKVIVAGDSIGGNLAAAVALKLKKKIRLQVLIYPILQVFDFLTPSHRENAATLKYTLHPEFLSKCVTNYGGLSPDAHALILENKHISEDTRSKYSSYVHSDLMKGMNITQLSSLPHLSMGYSTDIKLVEEIEQRALDPFFAPLMADTLDNVTDAYIITGQHDTLRDDGIFYCRRLNQAVDVKCELRNYMEGFHAFMHFVEGPLQLNSAEQALNDLIEFIDENVMKNKN